jgi:hypothetical protein
MKYIYGLISSVLCFLSLSFVVPPHPGTTPAPDLMAIANVSDVNAADSLTSGAIKFSESSNGGIIAIDRELTEEEITDIQRFIPVKIMSSDSETPGTGTEIVKYLISILGGFLTTIILHFLNKRWPAIFPFKSIRNYKKNDDANL